MRRTLSVVVTILICTASILRATAAADLQPLEFTADGVGRKVLIHVPETVGTNPVPVVFVFHGHGGSARQAARSFGMERQWPEAIVVYMQGLNTVGQLTDPQGKLPGWQAALGDQGDRDLKFFDAVLARIRQEHNVDAKRIYAAGHSNGGGFTYLLWLARGEVFAAFAPSAAAAIYANKLTPKPVMHMAGKDDPLVKFAWQQRTVDAVRKINGCAAVGESWDKQCMLYPSKGGTPVVTFIYPGGHQLNAAAPALIVKFFKQHPGETTK